MKFFGIHVVEGWVVHIEWGGWEFLLAEDDATIDVMEEVVVGIGLVRMPAIVVKDVPSSLG